MSFTDIFEHSEFGGFLVTKLRRHTYVPGLCKNHLLQDKLKYQVKFFITACLQNMVCEV